MAGQGSIAVDVRSFRLSEPLQPYFTALYLFTITCPPGEVVEDLLHPEWATMRFAVSGPPPVASVGAAPLEPRWPFVAAGPTSKAIRIALQQSQIWGLGMQPAGFARYVPWSAGDLADRMVDGRIHPAFVRFVPLLEVAAAQGIAPAMMAGQLEEFLLAYDPLPIRQEAQILACQAALRDPDVASVAALGERTGASRRSLERLCRRYFGFPPKLLLRRQRFLRTLGEVMLDSRLRWSESLDFHYFDQSHFNRDFCRFMGLNPKAYMARPHPIVDAAVRGRMEAVGAPMQVLHSPMPGGSRK